jgi:mono/diheme cytochrome c family protein
MVYQPKVSPQEPWPFGTEQVERVSLLAGVVPQEAPRELAGYEQSAGRVAPTTRLPFKVDEMVLARGEERFNVYCSPCHDRTGSARGVVPQRGFPGPIDLGSDNTRGLSDSQIFSILSTGIRNMPEYRDQIPVSDRWSIVVWVRVLQRSQHATLADVEERYRKQVLPEESGS